MADDALRRPADDDTVPSTGGSHVVDCARAFAERRCYVRLEKSYQLSPVRMTCLAADFGV